MTAQADEINERVAEVRQWLDRDRASVQAPHLNLDLVLLEAIAEAAAAMESELRAKTLAELCDGDYACPKIIAARLMGYETP